MIYGTVASTPRPRVKKAAPGCMLRVRRFRKNQSDVLTVVIVIIIIIIIIFFFFDDEVAVGQ